MSESIINKENLLTFMINQIGADNVIKVAAFTMAGATISFTIALCVFPNKEKGE